MTRWQQVEFGPIVRATGFRDRLDGRPRVPPAELDRDAARWWLDGYDRASEALGEGPIRP